MSSGIQRNMLDAPGKRDLAEQMLEFAGYIPASMRLEWVKDFNFLFYFEADRLLAMRDVLLDIGFRQDQELKVLDFGYLHGIVPEFLHRFFPRARFTVFDHPKSPVFTNEEYLKLIRERNYLTLEPCDIGEIDERKTAGRFDLIILGEIIEHLDPTLTARIAQSLRPMVKPDGVLLITTPNGGGIANTVYTFLGRDAQHAPIGDETMQYGHIHLWTPTLLGKTLENFGWEHVRTQFSHGSEREKLANANRHWGSFAHQFATRSLFLAAHMVPRWRAFLVSAYRQTAKQQQ